MTYMYAFSVRDKSWRCQTYLHEWDWRCVSEDDDQCDSEYCTTSDDDELCDSLTTPVNYIIVIIVIIVCSSMSICTI